MTQFKPVPYQGLKKNGRISKEEMEFIKDNIRTLGLRGTSRKLRRKEVTVKKAALEMGIKIDDAYTSEQVVWQQIQASLRQSPEFGNLRNEFSKKELKYFAHRYAKHLAQFREDVTTTEETQIFQLIKFEILMSRIASEVKKGMREKLRLENAIRNFWQKNEGKDIDQTGMEVLRDLENHIAAIRAGEASKSMELIKYQERHSNLVKDLKATRDQRRDALTTAKDDIVGLIKALQDEQFRAAEGTKLELVKLAINREAKKLAMEHKYVDGSIDLPILSADTVAAMDARDVEEDLQKGIIHEN